MTSSVAVKRLRLRLRYRLRPRVAVKRLRLRLCYRRRPRVAVKRLRHRRRPRRSHSATDTGPTGLPEDRVAASTQKDGRGLRWRAGRVSSSVPEKPIPV
jgi:hypothetical protein